MIKTAGSGSSKTNVVLNVVEHQQPDTDKIYLYIKDPPEWKYQFINGREIVGIKEFKKPKNIIHLSMIHKQLIIFRKIWKTIIQQSGGSVWWCDSRYRN